MTTQAKVNDKMIYVDFRFIASSQFYRYEPPFFNPTEEKIKSFAGLKKGWHYGEGISISDELLDECLKFHRALNEFGFKETDAFPGLNGEIRITIYDSNCYIEFTFNTLNDIDYCLEINGKEEESKSFSQSEAYDKEIREKEHLTQKEMAEKAHIAQSVIARIETGSSRTLPRLDLFNKILSAVGYETSIIAKKKGKTICMALS